jgi:hypothetical protein
MESYDSFMLKKQFLQYRGKLNHLLGALSIIMQMMLLTHAVACFIMWSNISTSFQIADVYKDSMDLDDTKYVKSGMTE